MKTVLITLLLGLSSVSQASTWYKCTAADLAEISTIQSPTLDQKIKMNYAMEVMNSKSQLIKETIQLLEIKKERATPQQRQGLSVAQELLRAEYNALTPCIEMFPKNF